MTATKKSHNLLLMGFALAKLFLHFAANANYGIHADELYYISMARHLQWGYYDNGPFITWMVRLSEMLFGTSTFAWRVLPSIFSALTIVLTGQIARRLGGGSFAVVVACTAMLCSPAFTATGYLLQPAAFDQFFWTALAYACICYKTTDNPQYLYLASLALGFGILNKLSIVLYAAICLFSIVGAVKSFRTLAIPFLLLGVILLPYALWQSNNGFPVVSYLGVVTSRHIYAGIGDYIFQLVFFHGASMAVWLAGLAYLLTVKSEMSFYYKASALGFMTLVAVLFPLNGKLYYLLGAFPLLMAVGGICWEQMLQNAVIAKRILIGGLVAVALIAMPVVLPILPFNYMRRYVKLMTTYTPINQPLRWDDGRVHELPQYFADMLGWEKLAAKVQQAGKKPAVVYAQSYAAAGAINYYHQGANITLIADNNSFKQWSPQSLPTEFIYVSNEDKTEVARYAADVSIAAHLSDTLATANQLTIYLLQKPTRAFAEQYRLRRKEM